VRHGLGWFRFRVSAHAPAPAAGFALFALELSICRSATASASGLCDLDPVDVAFCCELWGLRFLAEVRLVPVVVSNVERFLWAHGMV